MSKSRHIAIIGGGPAGLMAAEAAARGGAQVHVYDQKPTLARKFLMAGKSGLNITHSEDHDTFLSRYGASADRLRPYLEDFGPQDVTAWMEGLETEWFTGSSGRIFPTAMKASPLLRRWVARLTDMGVTFHMRHRWTGWSNNTLTFTREGVPVTARPDAVILAMGGASWRRLGSDGEWAPVLDHADVPLDPFRPSNVGFDVAWSEHFIGKHGGEPVKPVALRVGETIVRGEFVVTRHGIEGSAVYTVSSALVDELTTAGKATLTLDLLPDLKLGEIEERLARPRGKQSLSNHLRKVLNLTGVKAGLLRELTPPDVMADTQAQALAQSLKALPVPIAAARPMDEAISTAGGVAWDALDENLMLRNLPSVYCAGEMIGWDAPTGGYLITACLATGRAAGLAALRGPAKPGTSG
ncbi:TIGR03862 family flavoprotein [Parvularcula flava]|uniref:NAD(FAD)-utilizing dehydrogenase n=1 Tax=Aquisalinus luteolus TaxID=1566827 RepID=A0A8J3A806_9PROT|nr:TIGR03862 family flavoprotein [Aquisalinus luteolus]NHK28640.1 TIGR03862 family flavoprotein [Aquisalinus luteolus]GGH99083.1 NAD(FAD)-utilizing dehydrogenase [Aquisalinus luteolus]